MTCIHISLALVWGQFIMCDHGQFFWQNSPLKTQDYFSYQAGNSLVFTSLTSRQSWVKTFRDLSTEEILLMAICSVCICVPAL